MTTTADQRSGAQPQGCRVSLYLDGTNVDMALPADIPVEVLLPAVHDILIRQGLPAPAVLVARQLSVPGLAALDPAKSLRQHGIADGTVLTLTTPPASAAPVVDAAATVAATPPSPAWLRQPLVARGAGLAVAIVTAGWTGFLVVPGGPGIPDFLLAAAAISVTALVLMRLAANATTITGPLFAVACTGLLGTTAGLTAILCGLSTAQSGITLTVLSVAVLTVANRISVRVCRLSPVLVDGPERDPGTRVAPARTLLGALVAGAAVGAVLGVLAMYTHQSDWPRAGLAAAVSATLLLRLRHHPEALPSSTLLAAGLLSAATALMGVYRQLPALTLPLCLVPPAVGIIAIWLGSDPAQPAVPPGAARLLTLLEQLLPAAVIPLACWAFGAFGAVRGWALP